MQKLLSIFSFVLLYIILAFGQAVDISITVTDNASSSKVLNFGLDPTATDGIDPLLGESDLPPFPFGFEARFMLPPFLGALSSYKDYRNAPAFPFTGQKEHRLKYQVGDGGGTVINIIWDFPPEVTGLLKDVITGNLINVAMSGSGSYQVTDPSAYNQLKMIIDYDNVIPVELTSFTAVANEGVVELSWMTTTETNNQGFEIERNSGNGFEKVGYVAGFGTTTEPKAYSFTDDKVSAGSFLYRLKQIDFDGSFEYSPEVEVEVLVPNQFTLEQNYPNPFNPSTVIKYSIPEDGFVTLDVYNLLGERVASLVNELQEAGRYEVNFSAKGGSASGGDAYNLPSGIYIYNLKSGSFTSVKKMLLIK